MVAKYNNKKKTYYSYSRLWCWLKDPEDYYRKYVMGIWDTPSPKMLLGTIFSDAYAGVSHIEGWKSPTGSDVKFDWREALKHPEKFYKDAPDNLTFTPDYERIMQTALEHPNLVRLGPEECEQTILVESKFCPIQAKNDGYRTKDNLVIENKYGMPWTEERANTEDQVTFYAYVGWLKTGKIPIVRLQSVNAKNGQVKAFEVKKKKSDFIELEEKIEFAYKGIVNEVYKLV